MTLAEVPRSGAGCPACVAAPAAEEIAARASERAGPASIQLSLPTIHCAGCISAVERGLEAAPGVREARVNLTLKRVYVEAEPGVTPEALIGRLEGIGYEAHELDSAVLAATENDKAGRDLLMYLAVAFFANMNVMLLSVAVWSGAEDATRDLFHWISAAITIPTVIFSGQPFYRSAAKALRGRRLNMDVPISLAIILAVGLSLWETSLSGHHAYFDAALSLTFFLLLGRYLDHRTRASARSAAQELAALEVPRAVRVVDGVEDTVRVTELAPGDHVLVRPGARVPVDGVVAYGTSEIDRSLMTGESLPVFAGPDAVVHAGEINLTGPLTVSVTAAGQDTALHRIADLVAVAESGRANYNSLADRAARLYAPVVHLMALAAFVAWMWISGGDMRLSLNIAVATLIITCPCAMGLAVPAVTTAASGRLYRKGLLIKSGTAMERLAEIDTVVFDKTGTLTMGLPVPDDLGAHASGNLSVTLGLAQASSHPLALALAEAARATGIDPTPLEDVREVPGFGVEATLNGARFRLGRADWVGADAVDRTATYLSTPTGTVAFTFTDALRPGAEAAVAAFRAMGARIMLVSGDAPAPVEAFAARIGIDDVRAQATPEDKARLVQGLTNNGARVLMVGDGLNDTAALSAAHVSISPATALDAARVASDIVFLGKDFTPLGDALTTAVKARARIQENFTISTIYNVIAVPIALLGFATPLAAALAMSLSSISVSLNAMRLR
ncbi:MAG: cadmium-translocating P-type ATPase [Rhodobacteraceae bacterium]|nr:cadmium-translocating P-type ATPase [Paracoccaceae bacterium]